jgi:hypothetical protein
MSAATSTSNEEIDLVKEIHAHYDKDEDGFLNFVELATLQLETSGVKMTGDQYTLACKTLECHPNLGLSLKALRWTYAAEGSNVGMYHKGARICRKGNKTQVCIDNIVCNLSPSLAEEDYVKVFGKPPPKKKQDGVYNVGHDGVDISP